MGVTSDNPSILRKIAAGSISGGVAAGVTNPLDLIKTRMQSKNNPHKTMIASTKSVLAEGGVKGLWRGSGPSMVSIILIRCDSHDPEFAMKHARYTHRLEALACCKRFFARSMRTALQAMLAESAFCEVMMMMMMMMVARSASHILCLQLKVVQFCAPSSSAPCAIADQLHLTTAIFFTPVRKYGADAFRALSRYAMLQECAIWYVQARAAVLTASQCATYDEVKQMIIRLSGAKESFGIHLASSMVTGLVTTTATAPVDVIKTHMFVGE